MIFSSQSHFWKILFEDQTWNLNVPSFVTVDSELFNDSRDIDNRKQEKRQKYSEKIGIMKKKQINTQVVIKAILE